MNERFGLRDRIGQWIFRQVHERSLVYGCCWEDPLADLIGLELRGHDRVLVITSGGCNALDYLLEEPLHVHAVDVNCRQNALLELKIAGIRTLDWDDFFQMFGEGFHARVEELYRSRLREILPEEHRRYWDGAIAMFRGSPGFHYRTTSGWFARLFGFSIDHLIAAREPIARLLDATSIDEQVAIYERDLRTKFWGPWLGFLLRRNTLLALTGIPPQQRQQVLRLSPDVQDYMRRQAERVIYGQPIRENYFWRLYLTGTYTTDCCPRYLEHDSFVRLKRLVDRVTTHTATVEQFLNGGGEPISRFVLLDHMDWLTGPRVSELTREWQAILTRSSPDAKLLWRSLGLRTDFLDDVLVRHHGVPRKLADLLDYDTEAAERIRAVERVTAYGHVAIARWKPGITVGPATIGDA
jgi:S-adenosylmethionine-diacylglycerol 3-amino-3-carboxypropyl transferase